MAAEGRSKVDKTQKSRRRRKKRRTEDFSSDSSSSSSSSEDENENVHEKENKTIPEVADRDESDPIDVMDIDISPIEENSKNGMVPEDLGPSTKLKLAKVTLSNSESKIKNPQQTEQRLHQDQADLNHKFLKLFADEFSNDLEELRKKPDFTDKSLVILAKALQSGSNIFDPETLRALIEK